VTAQADSDPAGDRPGPSRVLLVFRLASFALGASVLLDAVAAQSPSNAQWVAGLLLVGIVPPEAVVHLGRRRR
jgi:hypothetical protein